MNINKVLDINNASLEQMYGNINKDDKIEVTLE